MSQTYPIRITISADTRDLKEVRDELERTGKKTDELADNTERSSRRATSALAIVKAELGNLAAKYQSVARMAAINITARFNSSSVLSELANLRRNLTDIDMRISVSLDNAQAIADLAALRNTPDIGVRINVSANTAVALAELQAVNALARDRDVTIRINTVGSSGATASINTLQRAIAELNASLLVGIQLLNDYSDSLDRVRRAANDAADAIRRAADEQERLRRAGGGSGGGAGNSETGWRRHARSVLDTANAYSGLSVRLLAAKSAIAVLTAAAAGAIPVLGQMAAAAGAVVGTALATANVAAMSKELTKLTETTGASAEGLQKWRLAARFEGVKADLKEFGDMTGVFADLSSQMDKLGTESGKDFADALKAIGLNAKDIKNSDPSDALLKIGDAIAKSNMSTRDKTAFLGAISDDAAKLLPLLEKTGQKFNEIADYASKVGAIQSDAQLAAMKQTNTELSYFKVGLEGVQTQLAAVGSNVINTLGPNIRQLFIDARAPLRAWSTEVNTTLIKFKADLDSGGWGAAFGNMFQSAYPTLHQFVSSAADFGRGYGEAFVTPMLDALKRGYAGISESLGNAGGAESLGKGLGAAMLPVIKIVDTIVASIKLLINNWDALKAVAAVTPIGLVAANWDSVVAVFELVGNGIRGVGEAFGLLNPATTANASGVQIFVAALGALLVSGAASRLVLGAIGATFSTLSFALAPLGAVLGIVATGLKAVALAAMANPIGALITVIAMGAALIFTNWSKVGEFFAGLWAGVKSSFSELIDWWNNTTPKEKVLDIKAATIDVAKEKYTQFVGWLNNTTPQQKILDIKTTAIDLAKTAAEGFKNWWDGSTLKEWASSIGVTNIDTAKEKASQFSAWWKETTLAEKALAIATPHIAVARIAAEGFFSWWDKSTLKEISPPIVLNTVEKARTNLVSFFVWWNGSTLTEKVADIKTTALNVARSAAESFKGWWASWTLKEVVANVTYETLVWAWEKGKGFAEWFNRWVLPLKDVKLDFSIIDAARGAVERFINWIGTIEFKLPALKIPDIKGAGEAAGRALKGVANDTIDGFVAGYSRFISYVESESAATAGIVEPAMRGPLKTNSPSKITEAIGADTAAGLGLGIEKGAKSVKSAAEKTARASVDAFKSVMDGLNRRIIELTQGDEAARRYELTQQKIIGTNQDLVISTEAQIKAFEDQRKKTDEAKATAESAAKAYADLISGLNGQVIALSQGDEAGRRFELTQQKITGANQDAAISLQNQVKALEAQKIKQEEAKTAIEAALEAQSDAAQTLKDATAGLSLNDESLRALILSHTKGYTPAMAASQAADEAKAKALSELRDAQNRAREALESSEKSLKITQQSIGMTDEQLRALTLSYEKGYTPALANAQAATEAQAKALESYRTDTQALHQAQQVLEARLRGGESAARAMELSLKGYNDEQIKGIMLDEARIQSLQNLAGAADGIGDAIADGLFSGNWKTASQGILSQLDSYFVKPLKKSLSDAIAQALTIKGGFFDSVGSLLNIGGIKTALGGVGSSIGGLFSSIASSAANGFAGIGTAISGGLSGIMGSFGALVSAIPGWGWALAGVAGLAKLFGGPSAPKIRLTQGANDGQKMLTDGQQHYTTTALGTVGATSDSYKIGREKGFVPKLHEWFKWVESFDGMIAKTLPNSIGAISEALKGVEMKGANLEGFTRQRLHTIFSALPEALQVAMQGGKNIMSGTTEEIAARFMYMSQVAESGLIPALEQLGLAGTQSKESLIAFAMGLADAMGGIDAAKAALDNYYQAAYTEAERLALNQSAAKTKLDEYNRSLGLSGDQYIDSIAKLRARIDAEDQTTAAGQKNIATLLGMVDALKTLSGTAEEAAKKLSQQWSDFNDAAYTDAQKQQIAKKSAQSLVDAFNQQYGTKLNNIIDLRNLMRTIDTTTAAGKAMQQQALGLTGALVTLGGTAQQIAEKVKGLRESIKGLVSNLYGSNSGSTSLGSSSSSSTSSANDAALNAANAALDSLRTRYDDEKQRIDDINSQAREAYQNQMDYYRSMRDAMQSLMDLANGFADDSRAASDTLKAAQLDYNATLKAAQGGDLEAAKKLGDAAERLKTSLGATYNNDDRAASAIQQIEAQLRATAGTLGNLAGSQPNDPGTITSTLLASLESQIKAQESVVSSLQSIANNTNSTTIEAKAAADRAAMAKELATKIGELGLATDKSAWQILAANGINIKDLAADFGINVNKLDATFIKNTADLANRLNVNSLDLLTRLNVNFSDLARSFNIDVNNLNNGTLGKLDKLADQLRVSSVDLAGKLGINIDQLGNLIANKLASLPNIPADIKAGLAPHLQDIRNAADPATLQKELKELQAYVNSLPPGIKEKLQGQLDGILGYTGDTKTNTADTKTETLALRSIRSSVDNTSAHTADLTAYTRDQVNAKGIQLALQNSRALNQHAAKIGKESIPSFAVGHPNLPSDMLANVHKGEMILTVAQAGDARDLVLHNQRVIPMISGYLSSIAERVAANDDQAPVFVQPLYIPTANNTPRRTENGRDELAEEIKQLRKELAENNRQAEVYQFAIADNTRKTHRALERTIERWDVDGLPLERAA